MKIYDRRISYGQPDDAPVLLEKPPKTNEFPFKARVGNLTVYFTEEDLHAIRLADNKRLFDANPQRDVNFPIQSQPAPAVPSPGTYRGAGTGLARTVQGGRVTFRAQTVQAPTLTEREWAEVELATIERERAEATSLIEQTFPEARLARIEARAAERRAEVEARLRALDAAENPEWN